MYSEYSQASTIELFVKIVNGQKSLTIFTKSFDVGTLQNSEYAFEHIYRHLILGFTVEFIHKNT